MGSGVNTRYKKRVILTIGIGSIMTILPLAITCLIISLTDTWKYECSGTYYITILENGYLTYYSAGLIIASDLMITAYSLMYNDFPIVPGILLTIAYTYSIITGIIFILSAGHVYNNMYGKCTSYVILILTYGCLMVFIHGFLYLLLKMTTFIQCCCNKKKQEYTLLKSYEPVNISE